MYFDQRYHNVYNVSIVRNLHRANSQYGKRYSTCSTVAYPSDDRFFFFALWWFYENAAVFLVFLFSISTETIIIGGNLMSALIKYTFRAQYNIFLWLFLSTFVPAVEAIPKDGHVRHISAYFWTSFRFFFWIYFLIYV